MADPVRLNLGAGDVEVDGYTAIDRKFGTEVYPLEYEDDSVDEIRASHVLEHFAHQEVFTVVKHWVDKLKPGGRLRIAVPDFQSLSKRYLDGEPINIQGYVMGGHVDENDYHGAIFDHETLAEVFATAGLERIGPWQDDVPDCSSLDISLNVQGFKPTRDLATIPYGKVTGVLSSPRFGPFAHVRCAFLALAKLQVPYQVCMGAYWHQVLSETMERQLTRDPPPDYILVFDYDSIFSAQDILELYRLGEAYPEADAICAVQSRRGDDHVLFTTMKGEGKQPGETVSQWFADFQRNLTQVFSGHFGCTLFRATSLRSHNRPWMKPCPDSDGRWGEGKVDADMDFWRNWRMDGKTLYLANHVVIGHLQELVTWPGKDYKPVFQHLPDYETEGIPSEVKR
jgi:predicted SAM-dependent methyltransferase